jgi:PII-like signaling protein
MNGYQLTFFTVQDYRRHGKPIGEWLVQTARHIGLRGATLIAASEGFGAHRRIHSAHFFELVDQPLEVQMIATEEECDRLFAFLRTEGVKLFYVESAVDFGSMGPSC